MMRVTLRGLSTRKLRSLLTGLAIVLGVALISGTYVVTDGVEKAFGTILSRSYAKTDAVITDRERMRVPGAERVLTDALLERIRALPQVQEAEGTLIDFSAPDPATLLDKRGARIDNGGPTFAFGIEPGAERFNPLELVAGRWAAGDGEVVIDAETATRHGFSPGDRIRVVMLGPTERFTIVGTARVGGGVATIGGAAIALFDVETAQRLHEVDGFRTIAVAARDGVPAAELMAAIRTLLPPGAEVRTGETQASRDTTEVAAFVMYVRYFLLAFGVVALVVAAFVIVNTLSITVAQRTRELATLRTLGASRRQVLGSVILEGLALGVTASVVGLVSGLLSARGLSAVFGLVGFELPETSMVLEARTAAVALAAGVGVTALAALVPAIRATRVAPLAAIRGRGTATSGRRSRRVTRVALLALVAGGAAIAGGVASEGMSSSGRLLLVILGGLLTFVGTCLMAPSLARPVLTALARPLALVSGPAVRLARDNALRNPARTAATAGALMIGLALTTSAGVLGHAVLSSGEASIRDQIRADYLVESPGARAGGAGGADAGRALASAPGVGATTTVRSVAGGAALERGEMVGVSGVDPASIARLYRFTWQRGSDAAVAGLGPEGAIVDAAVAAAARVAVGDRLVLRTRGGGTIATTVRGIFARPRMDGYVLGQVLISHELFDRSFSPAAPALTLVRADDASAVERAVAGVPGADVRTPAEHAEERNRELTSALRLLYVLLALAVVVSLLGMVNTLVLAVVERTREIGMLRALGMTRRQLRRMVRHEGILTALLGASLGIPLGVGFAAAVIGVLDDGALQFSLPVATLGVLIVMTVLVGLAAGVLPVRRASRLDVLEALQYQ